jgi:hypothetical protein
MSLTHSAFSMCICSARIQSDNQTFVAVVVVVGDPLQAAACGCYRYVKLTASLGTQHRCGMHSTRHRCLWLAMRHVN